MSFPINKFLSRPRPIPRKFPGKSKSGIGRGQGIGQGIIALRHAVDLNQTSIIQIDGRRVAIFPLGSYHRLERLLEQEEKEKELDRLDVEEAERRLADPNDATIPYEQVRRELGLDRLSD